MTFCSIEGCKQPNFSKDKVTGKGYCKSHQHLKSTFDSRSITQRAIDKHNNVNTKVRSLIDTEENKLVKNKAAEDFAKLQKFFAEAAKVISLKPYCMECGKVISQPFYRAATAHILPKRKEYGFPSIACHPDNFLILGASCGCHSRYDRSWEDAAKMKVFPLAIEKFKILYPLIAKSERKNISEVLLQEITI